MTKDIVAALSQAHRNMEHVLTLLRFQLDMLRAPADKDILTFLNNAVFYMHNFPGLTHHPVEEVMFKHLRHRAPASAQLCEHLSGQHQTFREQESLLLEDIRAARNGEAAACRRAQLLGAGYCTGHAEHIGAEDSDILPQAVRHLCPEDWQEVTSHSRMLLERLSMRDELRNCENLYDYLMASNDLKVH